MHGRSSITCWVIVALPFRRGAKSARASGHAAEKDISQNRRGHRHRSWLEGRRLSPLSYSMACMETTAAAALWLTRREHQ